MSFAPATFTRRSLAGAAFLLTAGVASASTITWNVNASGDWNTASNWTGSTVPGSGDMAQFTGNGSATTFTLDFSGATNNGANNQIAGEIFLGGTANRLIGATGATSGTLTLAGINGVILGSASGFSMTLAPNVATGGTMALELAQSSTIVIGNSGSISVNAPIIDGGNGYSLTADFTSTSAGTTPGSVSLGGANTYTGGTNVLAGKLVLDFTQSTSPTSDILANGSALSLTNGTLVLTGKASTANTQTMSGVSFTGANTVTLTPGASGGSVTLNLGNITRAGGSGTTTNFSSTGTLTTTTANDATGIIGTWATIGSTTGLNYAFNNGTALVGNTGATTDANADLNTVTSSTTNYTYATTAVTTTGALTGNTLRYTGAAGTTTLGNTLTLNGLMNAGSGALTFSGGSIAAGSTNELVIAGNNQNITLAGTGIKNGALASNLTVSSAASVFITPTANGNAGSATLNYTGTTTLNGGTLSFGATGATTALSFASLSQGSFVANAGTLQFAAKTKAGTSTYSTATGAGTGIVVNRGATLNLYEYTDSSATVTWTLPTITLNGGTFQTQTPFGTVNNTVGAAIVFGTGTGNIIKTTSGGYVAALTLNGVISGSGAVSFGAATTSGNASGTITINGSNTYTGGTTVGLSGSTGTIVVGNNAAFGAGSVSLAYGTLNVNGKTLANNFTTGAATLVGSGTLSGTGSGSSALTYNSSGNTLTLTGTSTYTGSTVINNGTLSVAAIGTSGSNGNLGSGSTVSLGSTTTTGSLLYTGAGESTNRVLTLAGTSGGGTINASGTGAITFTGNVTNTALGTKTLTLTGTSVAGDTISGVIANNATTGTTTLAAAQGSGATTVVLNSIAGVTVGSAVSGTGISGGTTVASISGNTITLSAATTATSTLGAAITVGGVVNQTGVTKTGSGSWTLSGNNTFTGAVTVSAGMLITGNTAALGSGGVTVASGATLKIGDGNVNTVTLGSGATLVLADGARLAFASTSANAIALNGGAATLGSSAGITLDLGNLFNAAGTYNLITGGSVTTNGATTFANFDSANYSAAFSGGTLVVSAVPEPATFGLLGAGALASVAFVKRRRKRA